MFEHLLIFAAFPGSPAGLALGSSVVVLSVIFSFLQLHQKRTREEELSDEDSSHFFYQDRRRWQVAGLLMAIGMLMIVGSSFAPWDRASGRAWGLIWLGVSGLVMILLLLAIRDWLSVRSYAGRLRREFLAERLEALRDERNRLANRDRGPSAES
jgi:Zn-dependent protease with chaperone function